MICCFLALLVAGPLGVVLAPILEPRRNVMQATAACCLPGPRLWRGTRVLLAFLLLSGSFATVLHFVDRPATHRLCTLHAFR